MAAERIFDIAPGATHGPIWLGVLGDSLTATITAAFTTITKRAPVVGDVVTWNETTYKIAVWADSDWQAL